MSTLDELTTGPLADEIAPYIVAGDSDAIAAILNRKDITVPGNLSVHSVKQYISLLGLRLPILESTALSCKEFNAALEDFKESGFDLFNPIIYAKIVQVLDALVSETLIPEFTEEHKLTLLSLGNKLVSRAEQAGLNVTELDVRKEIWADNGARKL